ncbi:hypothetical protein K439DRAFT_1614075 [Ramaria rubella]|nr:hypothetical protein K439DRAFT_1614075 [Ramaria rubella]
MHVLLNCRHKLHSEQQLEESAARRAKVAQAHQRKSHQHNGEVENIPPPRGQKRKSAWPRLLESEDESPSTQRCKTSAQEPPEDVGDIFAQLEQNEAKLDPDAAAEEGTLG